MNSGAKCKVSWTQEEDKLLLTLVKRYGTTNWSKMAEELEENFGGVKKSGKQCRQRWFNRLDPNIVKKEWSLQQQNLLFEKHREHGNKWIHIAESLPGRTDNAIKNHFYSTIRKSLRRMNKFLGSKDSTTKIRKIKPSTLSQIFSQISNQAQIYSGKKKQKNLQISSTREAAYHLINFSRWKLNDSKKKVHSSEIQKLEKLLEEVERINNFRQRQTEQIEKQKLLNQNSQQLKQDCHIQEKQIEAQDQEFQQSYQKLIQLQNNSKKRSRKQSVAFTTETETLNAKQTESLSSNNTSLTSKDQQSLNQKNKQADEEVQIVNEEEKFNFNLQLQQQNYPEINHLSGFDCWTQNASLKDTPFSGCCKDKANMNSWFALEQINVLGEIICQGQQKNAEDDGIKVHEQKFKFFESQELNFNAQCEAYYNS